MAVSERSEAAISLSRAAGCLAERYRDELKKEIPEIDALLGTGEVEGIVEAIEPGLGARRSALTRVGARRWDPGLGIPRLMPSESQFVTSSVVAQPLRLFRSRF